MTQVPSDWCYIGYLCDVYNVAIKGELNRNIKVELNDSFCALINKYNPCKSNFALFKRNFQISELFYLLTN